MDKFFLIILKFKGKKKYILSLDTNMKAANNTVTSNTQKPSQDIINPAKTFDNITAEEEELTAEELGLVSGGVASPAQIAKNNNQRYVPKEATGNAYGG